MALRLADHDRFHGSSERGDLLIPKHLGGWNWQFQSPIVVGRIRQISLKTLRLDVLLHTLFQLCIVDLNFKHPPSQREGPSARGSFPQIFLARGTNHTGFCAEKLSPYPTKVGR